MPRLSAKQRKAMPQSEYALPGKRAYPINNRSHAIDAKGRARQMWADGHLTKAEYERVVARADRKLHGGKAP